MCVCVVCVVRKQRSRFNRAARACISLVHSVQPFFFGGGCTISYCIALSFGGLPRFSGCFVLFLVCEEKVHIASHTSFPSAVCGFRVFLARL